MTDLLVDPPLDGAHDVVELTGEIDLATAADLRHALTDDTTAPVVVADFREVTFVDSSGLRALLEVRGLLGDEGRALQLAHLPEQMVTLLRITDTARVFDIREP